MTATPLPYVTLDLSAGGMARLQLALELGPLEERYVVLKWLDRESTAADPHASRRFLDEARLALELDHPNIVTVHQVLETEGRHCIVMAWIRGMSLRQVLQRLHPAGLPPRIASKVVHDLCRALHHAWHSRNERTGLPMHVVHRDLKPENVMLTLLGQTKVIDFGVAQATSLLTPSALHATPQYASPEQAGEILAAYGRAAPDPEDPGPLDGRSDLFCAGLILQELLTGRAVLPPPREPSTEAGLELLTLVHTAPVVPEAVPGPLAPILRRALAFQRRHRYATGEDMADALARAGMATETEVAIFLEGLFPDARRKVRALEEELHTRRQALPPAPEASTPTPLLPLLLTPDMAVSASPAVRRKRWPVVAAVAGVLLLAGGGGALWYQARMRPHPERSTWHVLPEHPVPEDGTFTLAIEVRNAHGQPVSGQAVRFEATGDSGARVELPDVLTDAQGRAEHPLSWQRPERVSVVPVILGAQPLRLPATSVTFEALAPDTAQSALVASSPVKAGERLELAATLRDVHGHPVAGRPVRFALEGTSPGTPARTGEAASDASGRASFPFETREAGDFTARASLESGDTWTALAPLAVRVVAGAPSLEQVSLTVEPDRALADDTATVRVVARVADAYANPVAGQPVLLVAAGEGVTLGQPGATDAQGRAEGTLRSTRAGPQRVCLRLGGLAEERCQETLFLAGPPALSGLRLVPRAREASADGRSLAELTLRVADAHDNPIPNATVRLSARGVGSLVQKQLITGPEGTALVQVRSKMTGVSTVTAQLEGTAFVQRERVQFVAGTPDRHGSSMSVAPEAALADGKSPVEVTVQVLDAEENPVRGRFVLLRLTGVGPEQLRRVGPTDEGGEASASFTSILAGQGAVSAELEGTRPGEAPVAIADARAVRFLAGLPGKPTLSVEPPRGRVGTPLQLTVEVWDQSHRNPLAGTEVRWDVRGSSEAFTLAPSKSDEQGRATVSLTPSKAGNVTLVAKVVGDKGQELSSSLNVGIDSGPPQEARLGVESGPPTLRADGTDRARLVLRLLDAQGNAVKGQAVRWEGAEEGDTLEPESDTTDETGRIRATFRTRTPGKRLLKALVTDTPVEASLTLTGERMELTVSPVAPAAAPAPADAGSEPERSPAE